MKDHRLECMCDDCRLEGLQEWSDSQRSPPPTPVIPEDVRETLKEAVDECLDNVDHGKDAGVYYARALANAKDWLAQCQTATDKAVCPKCGNDNDVRVYPSTSECICDKCDHVWPLAVALIISPPRAPKVEAKRKPDDPRGVCGCPHDWLRTNKDGSSVCGDCGESLPPVTPRAKRNGRREQVREKAGKL